MVNKKLNLGDIVLIFKNTNILYKEDIESYIIGRVINSYISDDLSYHGSPIYKEIYEVMGEDGKKYKGSYKTTIQGDSYFLTKEDYILYLQNVIKNNHKKVKEINDTNEKIVNIINNIEDNSNIKKRVRTK